MLPPSPAPPLRIVCRVWDEYEEPLSSRKCGGGGEGVFGGKGLVVMPLLLPLLLMLLLPSRPWARPGGPASDEAICCCEEEASERATPETRVRGEIGCLGGGQRRVERRSRLDGRWGCLYRLSSMDQSSVKKSVGRRGRGVMVLKSSKSLSSRKRLSVCRLGPEPLRHADALCRRNAG